MKLFAKIVNDFQLLTEIMELVFYKFNVEIYKKIIIDMQIMFSCSFFSFSFSFHFTNICSIQNLQLTFKFECLSRLIHEHGRFNSETNEHGRFNSILVNAQNFEPLYGHYHHHRLSFTTIWHLKNNFEEIFFGA